MFEHEGEGWLDWLRYLSCRAVGHDPRSDGDEWYCQNCGDVLPQGNVKRQP